MVTATRYPERIVVVARPRLGRTIEAILRAAGHEVHRTPDPRNLQALVARLQPRLMIIERDLPWSGEGNVFYLRSRSKLRLPVLLIGDDDQRVRSSGIPSLPGAIDAAVLLATVDALLSQDGITWREPC